MGVYSGNGSEWGVYISLPGDKAVYRISENYQPWRYCTGGLIFTDPGSATGTPSLPC